MHWHAQRLLLFVLVIALAVASGAVPGFRAVGAEPRSRTFEAIEGMVTIPGNMRDTQQLVDAYFERCEDLVPLDAAASQAPDDYLVHGNEFELQRCLKRRTALRKNAAGMVVKTVSRHEALVVHRYDFKRKGFPVTFRGELGWFGTNDGVRLNGEDPHQYITNGLPTHVNDRHILQDGSFVIASTKDVFVLVDQEQDAERIRVVQPLLLEAVVRLDKPWERWDEPWKSSPRRLMLKKGEKIFEGRRLIGLSASVLAFRILDGETGRILYSEPASEREVVTKAGGREAEGRVPEHDPLADSVPLTEVRPSDVSADATQSTDAMWIQDSELQSALKQLSGVRSVELERGVSEQLDAGSPWAVRPDQVPPPTKSKRASCSQSDPYSWIAHLGRIDTGGGAGVSAYLGKKAAAKVDGSVKPGPESPRNFCKRDNIFSVVEKHAGAIRACYERALRLQPNLQDRITLMWKIDLEGDVEKARTVDSPMGNNVFDDCLVRTVCAMRFAKPDGGYCIVQWPFVFTDTPK